MPEFRANKTRDYSVLPVSARAAQCWTIGPTTKWCVQPKIGLYPIRSFGDKREMWSSPIRLPSRITGGPSKSCSPLMKGILVAASDRPDFFKPIHVGS